MPEPTIHEVYEIGTKVRIGPIADKIEGWVKSIIFTAGGEHPNYLVVWWNGRTRTETEVPSCEIIAIEDPTVQIGFVPVPCRNDEERPDVFAFETRCLVCDEKIHINSIKDGSLEWRHRGHRRRHTALAPPHYATLQRIEAAMAVSSQQNPETP